MSKKKSSAKLKVKKPCKSKTVLDSYHEAREPIFQIHHNPYTIESELRTEGLNGAHADALAQWFIKLTTNKRLQFWIDECLKMFLGVKSHGNKTFRFRGIEADCADVDDAFQAANSDRIESAKLELEPVQEDPRERLKNLADLLREIAHSDFEDLKPSKIEEIIQRVESSTFDVNVLGCMKAGKSTVINAVLGQDLVPEETEACTATIIEIYDFDAKECAEGRKLSREYELAKRSKWESIDKEVLTAWNRDESVARIEIHTDIPAIAADPLQLKLVDTPGPNNSRDKSHGMATREFLSNTTMSMVIYILSAATTFTDDDKKLLEEIARQMNEYGKQAHDRFIFLLTRADLYKDNESIELKVRGVREHLSQVYGIPNPKVFPVCAHFAKLIRMVKQNQNIGSGGRRQLRNWIEVTQDPELEDKYNLNSYMTLSKMVKGHISSQLNDARIGISEVERKAIVSEQTNGLWPDSALEYALLCTGIPALEACIQEYMRRYAFTARIHDLTSEILHCLDTEQAIRDLQQEITKSQKFRNEVKEQLRKMSLQIFSGETVRDEIQKRSKLDEDKMKFEKIRFDIRFKETRKLEADLEKLFDKKKFVPEHEVKQILDAAKELVINILEDAFNETAREAEKYELQIIARSRELHENYIKELLGESGSIPKFEKIFVKFEFSEQAWANRVRDAKASSYKLDDGFFKYLSNFFSKRYKAEELKERIKEAGEDASHKLTEIIDVKLKKLSEDTKKYLSKQDEEIKRFLDDMMAMIEGGEKEQKDAIAKEKQIAEKLRVVANFRDSLHSMNSL